MNWPIEVHTIDEYRYPEAAELLEATAEERLGLRFSACDQSLKPSVIRSSSDAQKSKEVFDHASIHT